METKGKISSNDIAVALGDMTKTSADVYVVPQFTSCASYGGVGGAVARSGAKQGLDLFQQFVDEQGEQKFGAVLLTESGGGNSKHLLHVVSVGSERADEFNTVQTAFYNSLKLAEEKGLKKLVAPAMGTGIIGQLTPEQSAKAMMSAVDQYSKEGGKPLDISFVIYGDQGAYQAFSQVLQSKSYETAQKEEGKQEFSPARWVVGMARDADANEKAFTDKHQKRNPAEPDGTGWGKGKKD